VFKIGHEKDAQQKLPEPSAAGRDAMETSTKLDDELSEGYL
jgi:hypothetical protein